jgi:hypothetical protein
LDTVVVSSQHAEGIDLAQLLAVDVREQVVLPELAELSLDTENVRLLVNPTGRFVIGGPMGDAGLTGRKIIVDTYGGMARHGGGAFSGKDPSKVDRSAAYAMWWLRGWRRVPRCRWRTRSGRRLRWVCSWRPSVPRRWIRSRSSRPFRRCSTCVRRRSFVIWTCCVRSMGRPRRTATSAVPTWTCRGAHLLH